MKMTRIGLCFGLLFCCSQVFSYDEYRNYQRYEHSESSYKSESTHTYYEREACEDGTVYETYTDYKDTHTRKMNRHRRVYPSYASYPRFDYEAL